MAIYQSFVRCLVGISAVGDDEDDDGGGDAGVRLGKKRLIVDV